MSKTGLRTWTRKNAIVSPNSNLTLNSKKYFFWTRTWTRIKLFEFIRKILKLLKKNIRSLRNVVCCSSSHNPCKLKLWFYQKKSCMFICSCHCDLQSPGLRTGTWTRSFLPNSNLNSKNKILRTRTWTRTCKYLLNSNLNSVKNWSSSQPWSKSRSLAKINESRLQPLLVWEIID